MRFGASGLKNIKAPPTASKRRRRVSQNSKNLLVTVSQAEEEAKGAHVHSRRVEVSARGTQTTDDDETRKLRVQVGILLKDLVEVNMKLSKSNELMAKSEYDRARLILEKAELRKSATSKNNK